MQIQDILQKNYVQDLIRLTCGEDTQLVTRRDCFAVRSAKEGERDLYRILILPPKGFTANEINQMNSHDEADFATIEIKGAVKEDKSAFSKLKDCLLVVSKSENGTVSSLTHPYLTFDLDEKQQDELTLIKHSSGTAPFPVVKNDGFGFYHNLINLTDEWLVLKLHKRLRPNKAVDLDQYTGTLSDQEKEAVLNFYRSVQKYGDGIFENAPEAIHNILDMRTDKSLPCLGEMLFIHDSGMHEACTVFGIILKISQSHAFVVLSFLDGALEKRTIPPYYGAQLIGKIEKRDGLNENQMPKAA